MDFLPDSEWSDFQVFGQKIKIVYKATLSLIKESILHCIVNMSVVTENGTS